jgi:hypothetical protein
MKVLKTYNTSIWLVANFLVQENLIFLPQKVMAHDSFIFLKPNK